MAANWRGCDVAKHDDQVDSTAQMLDWFKQTGRGPTTNAGIWHLYRQRYEAQQAGASQTERPEPLSVMAICMSAPPSMPAPVS